jgi:hypothetical protein
MANLLLASRESDIRPAENPEWVDLHVGWYEADSEAVLQSVRDPPRRPPQSIMLLPHRKVETTQG